MKEGEKTGSDFASESGDAAQEAYQDASANTKANIDALAAPEKSGLQDYMKEGEETGSDFASQSGDTAQEAYQDASANTRANFDALAAPEKSGWQDYMKQGVETGGDFASQGGDTAQHFATDPNFDFNKEGEAYQEASANTKANFDALSAPEKSGWQDYMKQGVETGGDFASQGGDTAQHFATDPNFDFNKEGEAYQDAGANTKANFDALSAPDKSGEMPFNATSRQVAWQDFMKAGIDTGLAYANAGAESAEGYGKGSTDGSVAGDRFGQLSQETSDRFAALAGAFPQPGTMPPAQAAPEKSGWQAYMTQGVETGGDFASQGGDTAQRFATDPNFDFNKEGEAYQDASANTKANFDALSAPEKTGEVPFNATSRQAAWQDFMKAGIDTGLAFATAGAESAEGYGKGSTDGSVAGDRFGQLSQETTDKFASLSDGAPQSGSQLPTPHAASDSASSPPPAGQLAVHTWQEMMNAGINTGVAYAEAGADTAGDLAGGKTDGSTAAERFTDLTREAAQKFEVLTGLAPSDADAPATAAKPAALRTAPTPALKPVASFGTVAVLALLLAGMVALVTRRIKSRHEAAVHGHYLPHEDEEEV
jgi:predicted transcriptional regulator